LNNLEIFRVSSSNSSISKFRQKPTGFHELWCCRKHHGTCKTKNKLSTFPNLVKFQEITHSFDNQALNKKDWTKDASDQYEDKVRCFVDQYSQYRVAEVEKYVTEGKPFFLRGDRTKKEDVADCGGIRLSYKAYKKYQKQYPDEADAIPVGLGRYTGDQLFWLSFAQT
jgi:Peptidase family M13